MVMMQATPVLLLIKGCFIAGAGPVEANPYVRTQEFKT